MNVAALKKLQSNPAEFRRALIVQTDDGPVRLAGVMDDFQRQDFAAMDPAWQSAIGQNSEPQQRRAWIERHRGASKSSDIATSVAWALFASCRRISGVVAAADRDQAKLIRDAISKLVQSNPWLGKFVTVQAWKIYNEHTDSECQILSSDVASSYGLLTDFIVADEVTHWPNRDLFDSLLSTAAKRKRCLFLCISNAGWTSSWTWPLREAVRNDPAWYFSRMTGHASWISKAHLDEQRRLLPDVVYRRLWSNEWTDGEQSALAETDIAAAVTLSEELTEPERGWAYVAALDVGLSRDASALVVLGRHIGYSERIPTPKRRRNVNPTVAALRDVGIFESPPDPPEFETRYHEASGRYRVASVQIWKPQRGEKVQLEHVENAILKAVKTFGVRVVGFDPYQAEYLGERLRKQNVFAEPVQFVPQNLTAMATQMLEAFGEKQIDLPPDEQLIRDLRRLKVAEKSYGVRLDSPRGPDGHGDAATALSIGLHIAKRFATHTARKLPGDYHLVCYPNDAA